jgi:hypothetical protein
MKELKFIHITKTAGTSIENQGQTKNINWGRFHKEYKWWHEVFQYKSTELKKKYDWFMVVRNPFDRIVSEFYCKWGGPNNPLEYTKQEFNDFIVKRITGNILPNQFWAESEVGGHYTPQFLYLDKTTNIHILKFENLKEDFDKLMEQYNIDLQLTLKDNSSNKIFSTDDLFDNTKNIIRDIYKEDFEIFNYK